MSTSGEYYKIRIGDSFYLTTDNTTNGIPCYLTVEGASDFYTSVFGVEIDTDGGRITQSLPANLINIDFQIAVSQMKKSTWETLKTLRNALLIVGNSLQIVGTGSQVSGVATPGNFDVTAKPKLSENFTFQRFDDEYLFDVKLPFYTVSE